MRHRPQAAQPVPQPWQLVGLLLLVSMVAGSAVAQSTPSSSVTGRVLNAISGAPISRVLVQCGSAAVFTDHDGQFALEGVSFDGVLTLTKPGFFTSPERTEGLGVQVTTSQLARPFELRLYPEALLTGVVASQDGAPLRAVQVTARRLGTQEAVRRFETVASAETDSRGAFRIAVPAGDYQVTTQFVATSAETGLSILPAVTPSGSGNGTFHISSGEQQQLELRPHTGIPHSAGLILKGLSEEGSVAVSVSTSNGATWQMGVASDTGDDETAIRLPAGSYHLSITSGSGDSLFFGETRLTMPEHDVAGIAVQLASVAPIPVEVAVDTQASVATAPSPQELGLQLIPEQEYDDGRQDPVRLQTRRGRSPMLLPHPGRFRFTAAPRSSWYVESATYGGAEILGQTFTVNAGSGAAPLQLLVNNVQGSLEGKATANGAPTAAWIALLPSFPCATPMITLRAAADGTFSLASLQPGTYLAFALDHRTGANLDNPAVRTRLKLRTQTVTIAPSTKAKLDLELPAGSSDR